MNTNKHTSRHTYKKKRLSAQTHRHVNLLFKQPLLCFLNALSISILILTLPHNASFTFPRKSLICSSPLYLLLPVSLSLLPSRSIYIVIVKSLSCFFSRYSTMRYYNSNIITLTILPIIYTIISLS